MSSINSTSKNQQPEQARAASSMTKHQHLEQASTDWASIMSKQQQTGQASTSRARAADLCGELMPELIDLPGPKRKHMGHQLAGGNGGGVPN